MPESVVVVALKFRVSDRTPRVTMGYCARLSARTAKVEQGAALFRLGQDDVS